MNPLMNGPHQWVLINIGVGCVQLEEINHTVQHILLCVRLLHTRGGVSSIGGGDG